MSTKELLVHPALKDDQERLKVYNTPFETLKGHVYRNFKGGIYAHHKKWKFQFYVGKKRTYILLNTFKEAKAYQKAWASENPFERCGTVYVQFGNELLCRSKTGAKWWMSVEDEDLLNHNNWSRNDKGYIQGQFNDTVQKIHRVIMKRIGNLDPQKPHVDHVNHVRYDNRRSNLRWVTRRENNSNASRKPSASGRVGVTHSTGQYCFVVRCGLTKRFFYKSRDFDDAKSAWDKAVACRIDYERNNMHFNHTDYSVRKPLLKSYWESMQDIVRKNMDEYNRKRNAKNVRNPRKSGPSGRMGVSHNTRSYAFTVRCGSQKYFSYKSGDWEDALRVWDKAQTIRIEYEKNHPKMDQNYTDYLAKKPLSKEYWESMRTIVRKNMDKINEKKQRARRAKKRKGSPVDLGDKGVKK